MATDERLTLREAAERLGVHYMTAYRYVRTGRLPAAKEGAEWRVQPADLAVLGAAPAAPAPRRRQTTHPRRFLDRLLVGDEPGAWQVVQESLAGGREPAAIYTELVTPALREIGTRWAAGDIDIADEHRASTLVSRVIGRLGPQFARPGRKRGAVVIGVVAGDSHGLPTALLGDLLRGAGYEVHDLGADTPAASFVHTVEAVAQLRAVGVCATVLPDPRVAAATIAALRSTTNVPILLGGGAITDAAMARSLGADGWAASAADAVVAFESATTDGIGAAG